MTTARIMVVEDEAIISKDLQMSLEDMGYTVPTIAFSGEEAIKKAGENSLDLVVMDVGLQGEMSGIEAGTEICSKYNIPVIFVTAYSDLERLKQGGIKICCGHIVKPFDDGELQKAIEKVLGKNKTEEG